MAKAVCSGLNSYRNGNKITFTWTLPTNFSKKKGYIQFKVITDGADPSKVKWGNKITMTGDVIMPKSYEYTITLADYFPNTGKPTLNSIIWQVMPDGGAWAESSYDFSQPDVSTIKLSLSGDTFSWACGGAYTTTSSAFYFRDVEWQSILSPSKDAPEWTANNVDSGTGVATGSQTYSSDSTGYRHFRVRFRGINGASDWVALLKDQRTPYVAFNPSGTLYGNRLRYKFSALETLQYARPTQAQIYVAAAIPTTTSQTPPRGRVPAGATWTLAATYNVTGQNCDGEVTVTAPAADQCLWMKITTINAGKTTTSSEVFVANAGLKAPTITDISVDRVNRTATISFTNNSDAPGVRIMAKSSNKANLGDVAGTATSITFAVEDLDYENFGLMAYSQVLDIGQPQSAVVWQTVDTSRPTAPTGLTATKVDGEQGKVNVAWTGSWASADKMEISWSSDKDAWTSNLDPDTHIVENNVKSCLIAGLQTGKVYYFQLRAILSGGDLTDDVKGPYSAQVSVDLTEAPDAPAVTADKEVIQVGDAVTVSWSYVSRDGTAQAAASIYIDNAATASYEVTGAMQSFTFIPSWANDTTHTIKVSTLSESGRQSDKSSAVSVSVDKVLTVTLTTSLVSSVLTAMPLTISVTGAGVGGQTKVSIVRDGTYVAGRPDESKDDGFDGETIYTRAFTGNLSNFDIAVADLVGRLDENCYYFLNVTISDGKQTASQSVRFQVLWNHQPVVPTATITNRADGLVQINVAQPSNYASGDFCQIYRLSKDRPELIIDKGLYATEYIDPYPASGGGYRVVNVTSNGDYIGEDCPAWRDYAHTQVIDSLIIDFDEQSINLPYNLTLQSSWKKDFQRTSYLNGAVQGDWNKAVTMDASIGTVTVRSDDERIDLLRALAAYPGIAHVRTPDGASYAADVQVKQSGEYSTGLASFDLTIQRVSPEGNEGMTLADWNEEHPE